MISQQNLNLRKTDSTKEFDDVFAAPFYRDWFKEPIKSTSGLKLFLDSHKFTNYVKDYRKGEILTRVTR